MAARRARLAGASVLLLGGGGAASSRVSSVNTALAYAPEDTPARLFDDMYRAGGYVNDPRVIAAFADRIGDEILGLQQLGVPFHCSAGRLARRQAAGSTWTRAVYSLGMIGVDIARCLTRELENDDPTKYRRIGGGQLLQLHTADGRVVGGLAYSPRERRWLDIDARATILATGGGGQLFGRTTNARASRGIGYALALEAGAELVDMEFVSFEPFVSVGTGNRAGHDLPTTVLQEGARLLNGLGEEFLDTSTSPTKDIICRAMMREVSQGRGTPAGALLYDITGMDPDVVDRYVQIKEALRTHNVQPQQAQFEVMPAQHFLMGGVRIDAEAASTVPGLYAVGEVAGGAHGAHRLAACGGMEVVVGGAIAGDNATSYALAQRNRAPRPSFRSDPALAVPFSDHAAVLSVIRSTLDEACGVLRVGTDLQQAVDVLAEAGEAAADDRQLAVLRSVRVAQAIARGALMRQESRGDHFRLDFPERDDRRWLKNISVRLADDQLDISTGGRRSLATV
jgi:succinate dehydrogenase/fumarate reductase flavoprotein subunit